MLKATPEATCEWIPEPSGDDMAEMCGSLSRFVAGRDDGERGYIPAESCVEHLGESVALLADGDEGRSHHGHHPVGLVRRDTPEPAEAASVTRARL